MLVAISSFIILSELIPLSIKYLSIAKASVISSCGPCPPLTTIIALLFILAYSIHLSKRRFKVPVTSSPFIPHPSTITASSLKSTVFTAPLIKINKSIIKIKAKPIKDNILNSLKMPVFGILFHVFPININITPIPNCTITPTSKFITKKV